MASGGDLAAVAALVGDPGRANMLAALLDGRALTATELAAVAGVTPATASGHLSKLNDADLLRVTTRGRHRFYRLASGEVAHMLEAILVVSSRANAISRDLPRRATPRVPSALREARTCYDHLAGQAAVAIADALVDRGALVLESEAAEVTAAGRALLDGLGVALVPPKRSRRIFCKVCLDWSERRPHLGGHVGAALFDRLVDLNWIRRGDGRVVIVTPKGRRGLAETFGCRLENPSV